MAKDNIAADEPKDEPEIQPDRRKLSAGAATIRNKFTQDERKQISDAKRLSYTSAMLRFEEQSNAVAMQDLNLALIISGMESKGESEVTITNMLNNMHAAWPQLSKQWLKDLRKAVLYIRGASDRAAAKGSEKNVINEEDFLELCGYGKTAIEKDNRWNPTMFQYGNAKVALVTDPTTGDAKIDTLDLRKFMAKLNLIAPYRKSFAAGDGVGYQGVSAPVDVANQLFQTDFDIPQLTGVVTAPTFVGDGDLINTAGYNKNSGLYYAKPQGLVVSKVPRKITPEHVQEAVRIIIEELLGDFELDGVSRSDLMIAALGGDLDNTPPASVLNAIGMLVEQFVRPMIDGPVMPHLITKTAKGAGGGLLSNAIQIIVEGKPSSRPMPKHEDERRKGITTALKAGARIICWDNIADELSSPSIASATTEPVWTDRILGQSSEVSIPVRASFVFVGIRPLLSDELRRRMSLIEMKPQTAKPELRDNFRHEDLSDYVRTHRGDFIWAVIVLVKNWLQKDCPRPQYAPTIGSFQAYRYVVGGIIEAVAPNWTTWQSNRAVLDEIASDGEEEEIESLLCAWWKEGVSLVGEEASDLCNIAEVSKITLPVKRVTQGDEFEYSSRSMGRYLKGFVGRHFIMDDGSEVELCQSKKRGNGGYPWLLRKVDHAASVAAGDDKVKPAGSTALQFTRPKPETSILTVAVTKPAGVVDPFG